MYKVLIFAALAALTSCDKPKSGNGQPGESVSSGSTTYYSVSAVDYYASGMHFKVLNSANGHMLLINITKDSLEVAEKR